MPCQRVSGSQHLEESCCLHLQGHTIPKHGMTSQRNVNPQQQCREKPKSYTELETVNMEQEHSKTSIPTGMTDQNKQKHIKV